MGTFAIQGQITNLASFSYFGRFLKTQTIQVKVDKAKAKAKIIKQESDEMEEELAQLEDMWNYLQKVNMAAGLSHILLSTNIGTVLLLDCGTSWIIDPPYATAFSLSRGGSPGIQKF